MMTSSASRVQARPRRPALAAGSLVGATAAWGATFVMVKQATNHLGVESFLAWRFLIAGGLLAVARPRALTTLGRRGWAQGLALGLALAAGYALQTFGLRQIPAAVSGFLTGLQVVFVPLVVWAVLRRSPAKPVWVATALAMAGLATISLGDLGTAGAASGNAAAGELLTLGSALLFALQIVGLGRWSKADRAFGLATVQLLTVAACSTVATLPNGPAVPSGAGTWAAIGATAIAATAIAFVVQSWAQSQISATHTALILALEPVFATACAWATGEHLGWTALAGGALVVTGMLVVEGPRLAASRPARYFGRRATISLARGPASEPDERDDLTLESLALWDERERLGVSHSPSG
jgi:drug/metabolite transporter (DMT)-like permease